MKKKFKWLLLIPLSLVLLVVSIISIGYSTWIITGTNTIESNEITTINDNNILGMESDYVKKYDLKNHAPHIDNEISTDLYNDIYDNYTIRYYKNDKNVATGVNGVSDAGEYIVEYYNNKTHLITRLPFKIEQAVPTISISDQTIFYSSNALPNKNNFKAIAIDNSSLEGDWELVSGSATNVLSEGCTEINQHYSEFIYKFIPDDSNYTPIEEIKVRLYYYSVAYINNSSGNKYYYDLSNAINASITNDTIYVISNLFESNGDIHSIKINSNVTIPSSVTLCLPYDSNNNYKLTSDYLNVGTFADSSAENVKKYRKTLVQLSDGVTLTNNGSILIGGKLGWGSAGKPASGNTEGDYCEILLSNQSQIINNGSIECYGYIKETQNYGASLINNDGSILSLPFAIYDYRGGTYSAAAVAQSVLPFSVFDFPNCHTNVIYKYGSSLQGVVVVNGTSSEATVLGTANSLIKMSGTNSEIAMKYNASSFGFTTSDVLVSSTNLINKTKIIINGNVEISSLSLTMSGISINTKYFFCPFSYKFDIIIESGTSIISNKMKFLKGSTVTILNGATLQITSEMIMYQEFSDKCTTAGTLYPSNLERSKLINNGTLNITGKFGGRIDTTLNSDSSTNAKVIIGSNATVKVESKEMEDNSTSGNITGYAVGLISQDKSTKPSSLTQFVKGREYTSVDGFWYNSGSLSTETTEESYKTNSSNPCVTSDTLITLSDGSQVRVDQLTGNELLLVWDHLTGKYTTAKIAYIVSHDESDILHKIIKLKFNDGSIIKIIGEHVFYDVTIKKYVAIDENNVNEYVNHEFLKYSERGTPQEIKLIGFEIYEEMTRSFEVVTDKHLINFTNGILSTSAYLDPLLNVFELNEYYQYNQEQMIKDIEIYGLYTYEDFEGLIDEKAFEMYNAQYLKIAVGKGYITWEEILELIDIYYNNDVKPL